VHKALDAVRGLSNHAWLNEVLTELAMNNRAGSTGELDAEELLFLALQAMEQDRDEDAISCLKRGLALEPRSGILHHLLGAIYAQLGMIDRAIEEMTLATTYAPELHMASFQLGLLHFTSANLPEAEKAWQPLAELPEENPLALFRSGLMHLARDEFALCVAELRRGLERNTEHPSLNHDMRMLAEMAEAALTENNAAPEAAPADPTSGRHVLLSGYQGHNESKTKN
jgi:tetratricopeptide (TPR) repeat protein